jgi:hypothetical protein
MFSRWKLIWFIVGMRAACSLHNVRAADPVIGVEPHESVASAMPAPAGPKSAHAREFESWKQSVDVPVSRIRQSVIHLYNEQMKEKRRNTWEIAMACGPQAVERLKSCVVIAEGFLPAEPRIIHAHQLLLEQLRLDLGYEEAKLKAARAKNGPEYIAAKTKFQSRREQVARERIKNMKELETAVHDEG